MKRFRRIAIWFAAALIVALLAIQLVPVDRTNPPVETEVPATPEVRSILRRACYDCHSNETVWPWYSRIAPVSWLLARDVHEGREAMNYSTWNRYDAKRRADLLDESWDTVEDDEMPPWQYLPPHPEARLSDADLAALQAWAEEGEEAEEGDDEPNRRRRRRGRGRN